MGFFDFLGAGLSAIGGHQQAKQANKAAQDQARLNNANRTAQMMAQQKMMAGLESSGWNPFGVNALGSRSSGTSTTSESGRRDFYSKENPFVTDEYKKQDDLIRGVIENRLSRGSSLPPGYEANAIRAINQASAGGAAAAQNAAARRGLSGQQVFGLNAPIQMARAGQIADLRGNVPLLERQMMNEDMALSGQRQAQFGTGQERQGYETSSRRSRTDESSSGSRDQGPDISALSSLLMPPGAEQSTVAPYSPWGNVFSAAGGAASAYAGQQRANSGGGSSAASSAGTGGGFTGGGITGCPKTMQNPFGLC